MDEDLLIMWLIFPILVGTIGFALARVLPVVGPKVSFEHDNWLGESAIIIVMSMLPSGGLATILIVYFPTVDVALRITLPVVLFGGQYFGTIPVLWKGGLCRLCHKRDPDSKWGVCKDCQKLIC